MACSNCGGPISSRNKYGVCKNRDTGCLKENMRLQSAAARERNPEAYRGHGRRSHIKRNGQWPTCACGNRIQRVNDSGVCSECKYGVGARRKGPPCDQCGKPLAGTASALEGRRTTCTDCLRVCTCGKTKTPSSKECADCYNESIGKYRVIEDGYVIIAVPTGEVDTNGRMRCRRMREHRYVMEQMLGRELTFDEEVHHKNGCRSDNRPENLELWSTRQPKGQRVEDKVTWAKELLALYEPSALA